MENNDHFYLNRLKARAEEIYEEMYEASRPTAAGAYFSEIKELLFKAISLAREMEREEEAREIEKRLDQIRTVYESQMQ